jgi:DNA excision repair protein ERCC-3
MTFRPENPLIVQGDHTVLVEVDSPRYLEARDRLLAFAELVKSPEHVHTYRITPLSIWNACSAGVGADWIVESLREYAKYPVPENVVTQVGEYASRYGRLRLVRGQAALLLEASDEELLGEVSHQDAVGPWLGARVSAGAFEVAPAARGRLKQALVKVGFPAEDLAGYSPGEPLTVQLRSTARSGRAFALRTYQHDAAGAFHAGGSERGGSGVIVLPCGAGKTIVGLGCMGLLQTSTLILTTGITASRQWADETLDKTSLLAEQVGLYNGQGREIRPVTIATYNILTHRANKDAPFVHMEIFNQRPWGLIIYDEVHLLPAPVFQMTADLQARRRLGLTATLVREDGREDDVFALIGPKKAEVPWKVLEHQGWIAKAACIEVRLPLPGELRTQYALADPRSKFRLAAENPAKAALVRAILDRHPDEPALVMGMFLDQVQALARDLGVPVITGATPQARRDQLYADFKFGRLRVLAVSKVANFAVDLPDASLAIQVSGTYGSRQEEAQRLGRVLRPKAGANQAHFYTLVSRDTVEQDFALKRQLFLCEQGYQYRIVNADGFLEQGPVVPQKQRANCIDDGVTR